MSLNKAMIIGNVGRDCELRYTATGAAVATVSVATNETWTDKNGQKAERVEWHRIVLWGKLAEALAQYLTKGKQIYVEGRLNTKEWEKDGVKRYTTEIRADQIRLLGTKASNGGNAQAPHPADDPNAQDDDTIPF